MGTRECRNWCNTSNSSARCGRSHEALQSGTIVYHAAQGRALAFSRRTEHDHCLTAVNAGDEPVARSPFRGTASLAEDALSRQEFFCGNGLLRLTLEPYGTMLLDPAAGVSHCFT